MGSKPDGVASPKLGMSTPACLSVFADMPSLQIATSLVFASRNPCLPSRCGGGDLPSLGSSYAAGAHGLMVEFRLPLIIMYMAKVKNSLECRMPLRVLVHTVPV